MTSTCGWERSPDGPSSSSTTNWITEEVSQDGLYEVDQEVGGSAEQNYDNVVNWEDSNYAFYDAMYVNGN